MARKTASRSKRGNGAAAQEGAAAVEESPAPRPEPAAEEVAAARVRVHQTFGQAVLAMTALPRYRHLSVAELDAILLAPLIRDRVAIASARPKEGGEALSGFAIWASVSEAVDAGLREQIKAGVFPLRLKAEDWTSGPTAWLLDVIAPNRWLTTAVVAAFRQVTGEGEIRLPPMVARLLGPETLKEMGAAPIEARPDRAADRA